MASMYIHVVWILMSVEFYRGSPRKFDSRTLSRKVVSRWTGRKLSIHTCVYTMHIWGTRLLRPRARSGDGMYIYIYIYIYAYTHNIYIYIIIYIYIQTNSGVRPEFVLIFEGRTSPALHGEDPEVLETGILTIIYVNMYIYIYIYVYTHIYIYIYIYIGRERERERERFLPCT